MGHECPTREAVKVSTEKAYDSSQLNKEALVPFAFPSLYPLRLKELGPEGKG